VVKKLERQYIMLTVEDIFCLGLATFLICGILLWLGEFIVGIIKDWLRG